MKLDQILRYCLITGIFFVPFIPFIVPSTMFFPFITGKNFTFRILVEILFGLYAVLAIRDVSFRPRFSWLLGAFGIFLVVIGIADLFGENPYKSFWSNFERMEGYITFLHLFGYFLILSAVLNTVKLWERLFQTSLFASVVMSFYGVLQLVNPEKFPVHQGESRIDAALGNSSYLAIYLVFHIFLALFLLLRRKENLWLRITYVAVMVLEMFVLYRTETRGAILGLIGGVALMMLILAVFERENKKLRKISVGVLVAIVAFVGLFIAIKDTPFIKNQPVINRFALSASDIAQNSRFLVWGMALEGFKERPIFGWGQEGFNFVFNKYYNPKMYAQEQWFDRTHNVIMDWLVAGGILGLLSYLSLYLMSLFCIWRKGEFTFKERAVFTGMFAAYFFHNVFVFDNVVSLLMFGMFLAYFHSHATRTKGAIVKRSFSMPVKMVLNTVSIVVVVAVIYFANWNPIQANLTLIKAVQAASQPDQALLQYKKALQYGSFGNQEIREQVMQYTINLRNTQGVSDAVKGEYLQLVVAEMEKMIAQAPNDTRHHLFYGTVLDAFGKTKEAEAELTKALSLTPRKQTAIFQLANHYLVSGNTEKAFTLLEQAYTEEPRYREAKVMYVLAAIYANKPQVVAELFKDGLIGDDRLIRVYIEKKEFEKAIAIAKQKIVENPGDGNSALTLAAVYYEAGQKQNAIAVIQKIIDENPGFKDQGEAYIKEIREGK